ncbi:MAG: MBL fold metallo-hydrolase [Pseudomonadota bacterium]
MRIGLASVAAMALVGCGSAISVKAEGEPGQAQADVSCPSEGEFLQVLGSGGPIAEGGSSARAGTSYLLWIDGDARLLIDAGAGSFLRFAQARANISDLDAVLLTHLHADHVGDLPGILNTGGFEGRSDPLPVIGPDAAPRFPGTGEFLDRLLSKDSGAFAYNGGYLDGSENKPLLEPRDIATGEGDADPTGLDIANEYSVMAHPVHHGPVPALGYVIDFGAKSFVITGDQSFLSERFLTDLTGSKPTILFAHHVINGDDGQPRGLHRTPGQIGELAGALDAQRLVLTHNMQRSLTQIDQGLTSIAENYSGPVAVADDLDCFAL